ncbi:anthranilate synthase component I family protein [Evansella halocellulosilytica]|uniref:anthranilate synthase component I family protein n=1 Tax=Evansella halocellulosilytica TaxID=2011013 RepID=UPI000BB824DF|nr:chorismate-binding protein [Evansella halocellulosilytica]
MIEPSQQTFASYAKSYKTIPMSRTIVADTTTPIQLFHLFHDRAAFILESKDELSIWSNYSFIGLDATHVLVERHGKYHFESVNGLKIYEGAHIQEVWDKSLEYYGLPPDLPDTPFPGGAVGYFSFESYHLNEKRLNDSTEDDQKVCLVFCEKILAFNHNKEQLTLIHYERFDGEVNKAYSRGAKKLEELINTISRGKTTNTVIQSQLKTSEDVFNQVRSNETKETFIEKVKKVKEYITAGDVFQCVLSQKFSIPVKSSGINLYRVLRKVNPSPYLYYLRFGDEEIIGSSPERLIKIDTNRELEIHPIAGTRPRGKTRLEDKELALELQNDEKERAEHLMLVDLARNDIGKVSEYGSVHVKDLMSLTYFSHVMHLFSKVYGQLRKGTQQFEALFSAHPAGTVSGAPKVRAVEIIQELEEQERGVYAGAIAYCGWNGAIDSCIAIRTIILKNGVASVQAGAGIVHDSIPEVEYEETKNKAKALLYAIKLAELQNEESEVNNNDKLFKELIK